MTVSLRVPRSGSGGSTQASARCLGSYFLLRRWTRVRLSSLRCFFFAIRLRRFLITEPITWTSLLPGLPSGAQHSEPGGYQPRHLTPGAESARLDVRLAQVVVDGSFRHPVRPPDTHRRQIPAVHHAVDRH